MILPNDEKVKRISVKMIITGKNKEKSILKSALNIVRLDGVERCFHHDPIHYTLGRAPCSRVQTKGDQ